MSKKDKPNRDSTSKPVSRTGPSAGTAASASVGAKTKKKSGGAAVQKDGQNDTPASGQAASLLIDQKIRELNDWRGTTLARVRQLILDAVPEVIEEWKWMGTPVWSRDGIICTGESYKNVVKLTFAKGARIPDPSHLFNSSLNGNTRRAIDIHEGERINTHAFKSLIRAAVTLNGTSAKKSKPEVKVAKVKAEQRAGKVRLLSGGNPQIAKADGDAPVQAYIAAMPGWKRDLGKQLDELIVRNVPNVRKAVKWNSPLYGIEGQGWFLGIHCFTKYVKVNFFRGTSLRPLPPVPSKDVNTRYLDIREDEPFDATQFADWVRQAAALPGWIP